MSNNIALVISHDEALVLFDLLARFAETDKLVLIHNAEFVALSQISAQLDKALVEPFSSDYGVLLNQARDRLAAGFEGQGPGVAAGEA